MSVTSRPPLLIRLAGLPEARTAHPRHIAPSLVLKYIQAETAARLGVTPSLFDAQLDYEEPAALAARVVKSEPSAVVVQAATPSLDEAVQLYTALKRTGVVTVAVGQQVAHAARHDYPGWRESVDIPILGEPEREAARVLQRLARGESPCALSREYWDAMQRGDAATVRDPDSLARPRFDRAEFRRYRFPFPLPRATPRRWGYLLSAWGCPHACPYCTGITRKSVGVRWRSRQPAVVIDEIADLLVSGAQAICFEDDNLLHHADHALSLFAEIARRGLRFPWIAHARPDDLDDERVAAAAASGAALFKVGVETGSPRIIEALGKASSGEAWLAAVERGFALLARHGVGSIALFMIGNPGETPADIAQSIALAKRLKPSYVQTQVFCPYPDSAFFASLAPAEQAAAARSTYHYSASRWTPSRIAPAQLAGLHRRFYRRFYLDPAFWWRHWRQSYRFYLRFAFGLRHVGRALAYLLRPSVSVADVVGPAMAASTERRWDISESRSPS